MSKIVQKLILSPLIFSFGFTTSPEAKLPPTSGLQVSRAYDKHDLKQTIAAAQKCVQAAEYVRYYNAEMIRIRFFPLILNGQTIFFQQTHFDEIQKARADNARMAEDCGYVVSFNPESGMNTREIEDNAIVLQSMVNRIGQSDTISRRTLCTRFFGPTSRAYQTASDIRANAARGPDANSEDMQFWLQAYDNAIAGVDLFCGLQSLSPHP